MLIFCFRLINRSSVDDDIAKVHVPWSEERGEVETFSWRKLLAFVGPAFFVSIGYLDPGNCTRVFLFTFLRLQGPPISKEGAHSNTNFFGFFSCRM